MTALPAFTDPVILDGTTSPDYAGTPVIEIDGTNAGLAVLAFASGSDNSQILALVINRSTGDAINIDAADGLVVRGCYVGTDAAGALDLGNSTGIRIVSADGTTVGGTNAGEGNLISGNTYGLQVQTGAINTTAQGNLVGLNAAGNAAIANSPFGIMVTSDGAGNVIGGTAAGAGNVISGNLTGIMVGGTGTTVAGNYIGTDLDGTAPVPNTSAGLVLDVTAVNNTIGGTTVAARNVIAGNNSDGILITDPGTTGNVITANSIGVDRTGAVLANGIGISVEDGAHGNRVGGPLPAEANTIKGNTAEGIRIRNTAGDDNAFLGNIMVGNGGLGIDLDDDGVTENGGADSHLDFPVITSAIESGGIVTLAGTFDVPLGNYRLEFFVNPSGADPTGNGEGETLVGSSTLAHTGSGPEPFGAAFPGASGDVITATVTEDLGGSYGSTSEFSDAVIATDGTDLQLAKVVDNNAPNEGATVTYTVTLTNAGPNDATGITVTDLLPAGVTYVSDTPSQGSYVSGTGVWTVGDVANTVSATLQLVATVDGGTAGTTITNNAGITAADQADPNAGNNTASAGITVSSADLQLAKVVDNNAPNEGATVTYTVTLTNAGPNDATGIEVTDLLPAGVTYVSDTPSQGTYVSGTGVWTVGDVANTVSATLQLVATVDGGTAGTTITNNAGITAADQADPNAGNNTASAGITVNSADLQLAKVVDNNAPNEGATVTYTVTLTNAGPNDATGIEVTDLLPAGVTYVSDTPSQGSYVSGTGVWTVGDVANTVSVTLQLVATVDGGTAGTTITNNAGITAADQADPNAGNNTASAGITVNSAGSQIAGTIFEDADFAGTASEYDGGIGDAVQPNVDVELYDDTDTYLASTNTDAVGNYVFSDLPDGTYRVRARSATIGDADTPPSAGLHPSVPATWPNPLAEMTWGGGTALLGGQDAIVDDTDTGDDAGPGDSWIAVTVSGGDETGMNFGFAYNVITHTADDGLVDDARSDQGSLRQFLKNANAIVGVDSSYFDIAAPLVGGAHTIVPASALPAVTDPVVIDGTTEPDFATSPVVVLDGSTAVGGNGLTILAGSSTVRGLVIHSFDEAGIRLQDQGSNTVAGNFIGTDATGLVGEAGNITEGIAIYMSPNNLIGGANPADRNIISGNRLRGMSIDDNSDGATATAAGNRVIGNYVGTDANGANRLPYDNSGTAFQQIGIYLLDGVDTEIGGTAPGEGNVISGNDWHGVYVWGPDGQDNLIEGNIIGLDAAAAIAIGNGFDNPSRSAIHLSNSPANTIGGTAAGAGNEIAGNTYLGVSASGASAVQNRILGNSIHHNGDLGIDLGLDGVTINDADDSDSGENGLQNFPVIATAVTDEATSVVITGSLVSTPLTSFRIEFFSSDGADPSGYGEGELYLGSVDRTTSGSGLATFSYDAPFAVPAGHWITATATSPSGETSEFSAAFEAAGPTDLQLAKIVDNNAPDEGATVTYTVTLANAGPYDATGITVTDLLPAGVTYVSDTPSQGNYASGTGVWTVGDVANTVSATLQLVATVDGGTAGTTITNNAGITAADQADPNAGNNTASAGITVNSADLQLAKVVDNNAPNEGATVTYTVTLTNAGPNDATGITVTDLLLAGVTYVSDTPSQGSYVSGTGVWTVGDVANLGTATLQLVATVDGGTAGTTITNNASITAADQADPDAGNNTASAGITVNSADLQLAKVVDNNAPNEGATVTYTVTLTNAGPNDATGIEVTDLLPAGVTYVSDTPSQGSYVSGTGVWTVGDVANTVSATLQLVATVDGGTAGTTIINNTAITAADQADPDGANNTAAAGIDVDTVVPMPGPIQLTVVPLDTRPVLPGGSADEALRFRLTNQGTAADTLRNLTIANTSTGAGTAAQLDADWRDLSLLVDSSGLLGPPATVGAGAVTTGTFSAGSLTFSGLAVALPPGATRELVIMGCAALGARDGDLLSVAVTGSGDIGYAGTAASIGTWPLATAGVLAVDGMVADQLDLRPVDPSVFMVGSARNLLLDVGLPANGYEGDQLDRLNLINLGDARDGFEIARLEAWADQGDSVFDPLTDTLLGEFAHTGSRWELTGLTHVVPLTRLRIYVTVDIAGTAADGRSFQLGLPTLPDVGIGMVSGNDGPIDREVVNPFVQTVSTADRVLLSSGTIVPGVVAPGQVDVPLLHLVGLNAYADDRRLVELTVTNGTEGPGAPSVAERDGELARLNLRADGDGDGQLGDLASDPIVATGSFSGGRATFSGLSWDLAAGTTGHLFLTGDVSLTGAADGDVLAALVSGGIDIDFATPTTVAAAWPLTSGARWTVDGMTAAQVGNAPISAMTLAAGEGPALVMDLLVPANGYAADHLTGLRLVNRGTAGPADIAELRLWGDGGDGVFSAAGGDDVDLGPCVWVTDAWHSPVLDVALPPSGLRLFAGLTVSAAPTNATTVRLAVPVGGISVASDNDGPRDLEVQSPTTTLLSTAPLLAQVRFVEPVSTVGQPVVVRMLVRNVGSENLLGVAPRALVPAGDGVLTPTSGPMPVSLDLAIGAVDSFSWTYTATSSGGITFSGSAEGTGAVGGQLRASLTAVSGEHRVFDPAGALDLYAVANMPFSIVRGQTDVVPLSLTFVNPGGAASAEGLLRGLRISLKDDAGGGVVPADLLARVVVNEGGITYLDRTTLETSGDQIDLTLSRPVPVTGLEPVTLGLRLDILATTTVPAFMVEITDATWFDAADAINGAAVPIVLRDGAFPIQSGLGTLLVEATGLQVAAAPAVHRQVGFGQRDVTLLVVDLLNPGAAGLGSDVRVASFAFSLTDTLGAPLATPSSVLDKLIVTSPLQTLVEVAVADHDSTVIVLDFSSPLTVPVDTPLEMTIAADIADPALAGAVQARLTDSSAFLALDGNSGAAVPVTFGTDPLIGHTLVVQEVATLVMAEGDPRLPDDLIIGAQDVPALDFTLRHPGGAAEADIVVESLVVQCRDEHRALVPPGGLIDGLTVLRDGLAVGTISNPVGNGNIVVPVTGIRLQPGVTIALTLNLDLEATAPTGTLELLIPGDGLVARDANLAVAVTAQPESGEEFPLTSGITRLQDAADELQVGFASLMPAVLTDSPLEIPVARVTLRNPDQGGTSGINPASVAVRAADERQLTIPAGGAVEEILLYDGDQIWATSGTLTATDTLGTLVPVGGTFIGPGVTLDLELRVQFRSPPTVAGVRFGIADGDVQVVQPTGTATVVRVEPEDGHLFPYWTDVGSFTGASLAGSYSNFPNPFAAGRENTTFVFALDRDANVTLRLLTGHNRPVASIIDNESRAAGLYQLDVWDGRNGRGVAVQNGVYIAELIVTYADGSRDRQLRKVAVVR